MLQAVGATGAHPFSRRLLFSRTSRRCRRHIARLRTTDSLAPDSKQLASARRRLRCPADAKECQWNAQLLRVLHQISSSISDFESRDEVDDDTARERLRDERL